MESGELVYFDLDDLIDIAEYYHIKGDYELANAVADYSLQLYPDNSSALLFKARLSMIDYNDTKTAAELLEGMEASIENMDVVYTIAEIKIREGDVDWAEQYLERQYAMLQERYDNTAVLPDVMSADDEDDEDIDDDSAVTPVDFAIETAIMYMDSGYADMAEKWMKECSVVEGDAAVDYYDVYAKIYMSRRLWAEAEQMLNRLIDIDAYRYDAWLMMSDIQYQQAHYRDALQSVEYAIAISPDLPEPHLTRGNCLYALGELDDAQKSFERYLAINPGDTLTELLLVSILYCQKKNDEACEVVRRLLTHVADLSWQKKLEALQSCASICAKIGNMDMAMQCCDMLEEDGAPQLEVELVKGIVSMGNLDVLAAMTHFTKALKIENYSKELCMRVGVLLYNAGSMVLAQMMLEMALDGFEANGYVDAPRKALAYMAGISRLSGMRDEYLYYLEYAVKLAPIDASYVLSAYFPKGTEPSQYLEIEKNRNLW